MNLKRSMAGVLVGGLLVFGTADVANAALIGGGKKVHRQKNRCKVRNNVGITVVVQCLNVDLLGIQLL